MGRKISENSFYVDQEFITYPLHNVKKFNIRIYFFMTILLDVRGRAWISQLRKKSQHEFDDSEKDKRILFVAKQRSSKEILE